MRGIRVTTWYGTSTNPVPMTAIVTEADIDGTPEEFVTTLTTMKDGVTAFVGHEFFDVPDDHQSADAHAATLHWLKGRDIHDALAQERYQAILFLWLAELYPAVREGGLIAPPDPAPLSHDEIVAVLVQFTKHPAFKASVRLLIGTNHGTTVEMKKVIPGVVNPPD